MRGLVAWAAALEGLLLAPGSRLEAAQDVGAALHRYRGGGFGFSDLMLAATMRRSGASRLEALTAARRGCGVGAAGGYRLSEAVAAQSGEP